VGNAVRCLVVAVAGLFLLPGVAPGATVERDVDTGVITVLGQAADADDILVERTSMFDIVSRAGGGLVNNSSDCTGGGADPVLCPRGSSFAVDLGDGNDRFRAPTVGSPISIAGGAGNDDLQGGGAADVLAGGAGNDTLDGGTDVDEYFGEGGDDIIEARDGHPERIACGAGQDEAHNDFIDIIAECERGIDGDRDGFSTAVDCNDAAAGIFPGAAEVFDNGVDENCDGRDNPNLDVDRDGFARPLDCDDGNAAARPTAPEVRGNAVDENCDKRAEPFSDLGAVVANQWVFGPAFARLTKLVVHNAPAGARVVMRCSGRSCPSRRPLRRTVKSVLSRVVLHRGLRRARLRPGTKLTVTITAAETVGRTYTYVVKRGGPPESTILCRAPGERKGRRC
jgi:hypothetical protein